MERETVNALILKLWDIGESLKQIQSALNQIEFTIADEVDDDTL